MSELASGTEVQRLLVRALEDEEQRLLDLEERVTRLQARPSQEAATVEIQPPAQPRVTEAELQAARDLLAQSGRHLRELERRMDPSQPVGQPRIESPSQAATADADWEGAEIASRLPPEPGTETAPSFVPPTNKRPPDTDSFRHVLAAPRSQDEGFRGPVAAPSAQALATPATAAGWGEVVARSEAPTARAPQIAGLGGEFRAPAPASNPGALASPQTAAGWGGAPVGTPPALIPTQGVQDDRPPTTAAGWADPGSAPPHFVGPPLPRQNRFRGSEVLPSAVNLATPATSQGWGEAAYVQPPIPAPILQAAPAYQLPPQVIHSPLGAPLTPHVVLPAPTEVIRVPPPPSSTHKVMQDAAREDNTPTEPQQRTDGLQHSGVSARSQAAPRQAIPSGAVPRRPVEPDRFELNKAFGGYEPSLKEVAHTQALILERLEVLSQQLSHYAYGAAETDALRERAEAAELACARAAELSHRRAQRVERLSESLAEPRPQLNSKDQLVELLRQVSGAHSRPEASALGRLRERLLHMSGEHQALVHSHAQLLEQLLGMLEEGSEDQD